MIFENRYLYDQHGKKLHNNHSHLVTILICIIWMYLSFFTNSWQTTIIRSTWFIRIINWNTYTFFIRNTNRTLKRVNYCIFITMWILCIWILLSGIWIRELFNYVAFIRTWKKENNKKPKRKLMPKIIICWFLLRKQQIITLASMKEK